MGDDLLHPLIHPRRLVVSGPRLVILALLAGFVLMVLALSGRNRASAAALPPRQVASGHQLFEAECSSCHGTDATGTANGPSLIDAGAIAADFYLRTGRMPLNDPQE